MASATRRFFSKLFFYSLILTFCSAAQASLCYFIPPAGWEFADPSRLSPRVQIGFVTASKNRQAIHPSINLAIEEKVEVGMEEYLKCVQVLHEKKTGNRWRDLGAFSTLAGPARLTSIDTKISGTTARLLQLIFLKDKKAYILTAAAGKEDFAHYHKDFEQTFHSLRFTDNLLECLSDTCKRSACQRALSTLFEKWRSDSPKFELAETHFISEKFQSEAWLPFQKCVLSSGSEWGPYGQLLFLKEAQRELSNLKR